MSLTLAPRPDERLTALERLEVLCDPGSISLVRTDVRSRRMGEKARGGDGVLGGSGRVDGRPVFCFAQDVSFLGGSRGAAPRGHSAAAAAYSPTRTRLARAAL